MALSDSACYPLAVKQTEARALNSRGSAGPEVHAGGRSGLVEMEADHPGFHDLAYRQRRDHIAQAAFDYRDGNPVPVVDYTEVEHGAWREVWAHLHPLHERYACGAYQWTAARVGLPRDRIPQLGEVNARIEPIHGFRMLPVAGLVAAGTFLSYLSRGVFLSTQYMRHHSVPLYTPEPDVIHELVGHAATFADEGFARINRLFGQAALRAVKKEDDALVERIARLYWYTLEFGVVGEGGRNKVYGAGLLSSFGELGRFETEARLLPFDAEAVAGTPYDPTAYQGTLFRADNLDTVFAECAAWLTRAAS